jgi:hypothetical protein
LDDNAINEGSQFAEAQETVLSRAHLSLEGVDVQSIQWRWEVPAPFGAEWGIPEGKDTVHIQTDENFKALR